MYDWGDYARIVTSLFVIADPIGTIPLFISLTAGQSAAERRTTARLTAVTFVLVLVGAVFLGEPLLHLFGISLSSFRVAGGILLLLMAIAMLHARHGRTKHTPEEDEEAADKGNVGVVPLGVPLLAGPGAISTMTIYAHQAQGWQDTLFLVCACFIVAAAVWAAMRLAEPVSALFGTTGINITTRLMGLILAAVAVEFITTGLVELLPGLV